MHPVINAGRMALAATDVLAIAVIFAFEMMDLVATRFGITKRVPAVEPGAMGLVELGQPAFDHCSYQSFILFTSSVSNDQIMFSKQVEATGYTTHPVLKKFVSKINETIENKKMKILFLYKLNK